MEPAGVVGLAAAAFQFLDFGSRLLSTSYTIYKSPSGQTAKQVALDTIVKDFSVLLGQVENTTSSAFAPAPASPAQGQLLKLCGECQELIAPLINALGQLQNDGHADTEITFDGQAAQRRGGKAVVKTVKAALKAVLKDSEMNDMIEKLEAMHRRMISATLFALW